MTRFAVHPVVLLLALVHMMVDGYGGMLTPLLPLIIPRLGLTLAGAGTLVMAFQFAASVLQIAFGRLADRWRPRALVMAGPVLCVATLSLVGLSPNRLALTIVLMIGGLGTAAFHPAAAALAHQLGGERKGWAMSVYITGGTLGLALAPLFFAPFVDRFGLAWTPLLAIPGLVVVGLFLRQTPVFAPRDPRTPSGFGDLKPYAKPLALLYFIVVFRTIVSLGFATFTPILLTERGASVSEAGVATSAYLFAGGIGGFLGGPLADRFGERRVIAWSLLLAAPPLLLAPGLGRVGYTAALAVGGLFLQSTLPVNVIFGQRIAPVSAATVSSLMMGFAWGMGGMCVPLVGLVADRIGIAPTLEGLALLPILTAVLTLPLPRSAPFSAPFGVVR